MRSAYDTGHTPGVGTLQRIKIERSGFERLARRGASWRSFSRQRSVILLDHGPVFRWNLGGGAEGRFPSRVAIEFPPDIELEVLEAGDDRRPAIRRRGRDQWPPAACATAQWPGPAAPRRLPEPRDRAAMPRRSGSAHQLRRGIAGDPHAPGIVPDPFANALPPRPAISRRIPVRVGLTALRSVPDLARDPIAPGRVALDRIDLAPAGLLDRVGPGRIVPDRIAPGFAVSWPDCPFPREPSAGWPPCGPDPACLEFCRRAGTLVAALGRAAWPNRSAYDRATTPDRVPGRGSCRAPAPAVRRGARRHCPLRSPTGSRRCPGFRQSRLRGCASIPANRRA